MKRHTLQLLVATALCIAGITLLAIGLIAPPLGQIHHSVLIALGELLSFAGSIFGIDYHYRTK